MKMKTIFILIAYRIKMENNLLSNSKKTFIDLSLNIDISNKV